MEIRRREQRSRGTLVVFRICIDRLSRVERPHNRDTYTVPLSTNRELDENKSAQGGADQIVQLNTGCATRNRWPDYD